jgi:hypothetical protein
MIALARPAHADGAPIPPYGYEADIEMPGQKAIIVYDAERGREDLILSVQLLAEVTDAAWVVPLPSPPEVNAVSAEWFVQLSDLTQPEIVTRTVAMPMLGMGAAPQDASRSSVELLSRERVGVYDVSVLSAEEPMALLEWLNEHDYDFPKEGEPILDAYVEEGWYFVATRVLPGETANLEGDVQPLWLSFDTERPVYPMRLTSLVDNYMDVLIYVLAAHRMEVKGLENEFETEFAGTLTLEPAASEESTLQALLTGQPYYVTKLRNSYFAAWDTADDLYFQRAPTDEPYRRVVYRTVTDPTSACCSCCLPGLTPLGLVVGLGLMAQRARRREDTRSSLPAEN